MPVLDINTLEQWKSVVINSQNTVVVDFYASWCGPCRAIAPKYEELSNESSMVKSGVIFAKVNTENKDLEQVTEQLMINAIPTMIVFKNGKIAHTTVGVNLEQVKQAVVQLFP